MPVCGELSSDMDDRRPTERDKRREHFRLLVALGVVGAALCVAAFHSQPVAAAAFAVAGVRGTVILARGWPKKT